MVGALPIALASEKPQVSVTLPRYRSTKARGTAYKNLTAPFAAALDLRTSDGEKKLTECTIIWWIVPISDTFPI